MVTCCTHNSLQHSGSNNATRLRHLGSRSYTQTTPEKPPVAAVTTESAAVKDVSAISLPDSPIALVSDASPDFSDTFISNVVPALQYGDFATLGLSSWSPIGLVAWTYEIINVTTGLPWFWTIVAGATACRLFCLPFAIRSARASARMRKIQPEMAKAREKIGAAAKMSDPVAQQRAAYEMQALYTKAGVKIGRDMVLPAVIQIPVAIGMFFATKRMCELPVSQLKESGFSLLPDLTVADPTMILPISLCAVVNAQISVGI
jgi:YidC/Oxa1 family membrane protein insertase